VEVEPARERRARDRAVREQPQHVARAKHDVVDKARKFKESMNPLYRKDLNTTSKVNVKKIENLKKAL
jgi:hypothetical protein